MTEKTAVRAWSSAGGDWRPDRRLGRADRRPKCRRPRARGAKNGSVRGLEAMIWAMRTPQRTRLLNPSLAALRSGPRTPTPPSEMALL
eukprot:scaffold361_cov248-Pinguiococcus_pyrenoidosus.AAC.6